MEYMLFAENDPYKLAAGVNEACADGWEPFGGPAVAATIKESWYHYQAVIRKTPDTKDDSQNVNQQLKDSISELKKVHRTISHVDGFMARGECLQILNAVITKLESI